MTSNTSLLPEVRENYTKIVDDILSRSDLATVSGRRIRQGIQDRVEYDITPQKALIKALILERFDIFNAKQSAASKPVPSVESTEKEASANGHVKSESRSGSSPEERKSTSISDDATSPPPKKKKRKVEEEKDDAAFAAKLQAEENRNARPSRNGAARKATPKKKTTKKKTAVKVTGSDDSDVEEGTTKRAKNESGFNKPMNLSPMAADFFGVSQVTKQVWAYIKDHSLQDPSDKRYINCDTKLAGLLKQDRVHMFTMTKILSAHIHNPDE